MSAVPDPYGRIRRLMFATVMSAAVVVALTSVVVVSSVAGGGGRAVAQQDDSPPVTQESTVTTGGNPGGGSGENETSQTNTDSPDTTEETERTDATVRTVSTREPAPPPPQVITPTGAQATAERASVILRCDRDLPNPPLTTYGAEKLIDGDVDTGWGAGQDDGTGESVTIFLPGTFEITSVALTPGFAKVGPRQDTDCRDVEAFPRNGFVAQVRWSFDDGTSFVQQFEQRKQLQRIDLERAVGRAARSATVTITLEQVIFPPGADRDTILSEARVWGLGG